MTETGKPLVRNLVIAWLVGSAKSKDLWRFNELRVVPAREMPASQLVAACACYTISPVATEYIFFAIMVVNVRGQ